MKTIWSLVLFTWLATHVCFAAEYQFVSIEKLIEQEVGRRILPEIYKSLGIEISIKPLPGKRAQKEAMSGRKDGEIMRIWTYGQETPTTIRVPTPYYYLETMPFVKKGSGVVINSKEDLKKYKVVKVRGVKHTNNITGGMPNVYDSSDPESMMTFLKKGRADVALTNTLDGVLVLKKLGFTNIVPLEKPLAILELYHYIHADHKALVPRVDAAIQKMKANGELQALITKAEKELIERVHPPANHQQ